MAIQSRIAKVGLSKQTAKGAGATSATYASGVTSGPVVMVEPVDAPIETTWSNRVIPSHDRSEVKVGAAWGMIATPSITGLILLGALGADAVTGTGPFTHVLTSAIDLPYLTAWALQGAADWAKIVDCKVVLVELAWDKAGKVTMKADFAGITPSMLAAPYTETNQELLATVGYFDPAGGIFNVEGQAAQIHSGSIKIETGVAPMPQSASVLPGDVVPGQQNVLYSLKITPNDTALFREVVFGSGAAGALPTVAVSPYYGAVDLKFLQGATNSLEVTSPRVRFACKFPDVKTAGGPAEVTLEGQVAMPASGADTTVTLINSVATY